MTMNSREIRAKQRREAVLFPDTAMRLTFAGSVLGRSATGMVSLSVILLARDVTGSFAVAGTATGAFALASVVAGPARSAFIVRVGHRLALTVLTSVMVLGLCALAFVPVQASGIVVLAAVVGLASPPFGALMRAGWSAVLPKSVLPRAFGLDAVCEEVTLVAGPLLVGAVLYVGGAHAPIVAAGALALVGASLMGPGLSRSAEVAEAHDRVSVVTAVRGMVPVLVVLVGVGLTVGLIEVGVPAIADDLGHLDLAGLLLAVLSASSAVGAFLFGRAHLRRSRNVWLLRLGATAAIGAGLLAASVNLAVLLVLLVVAGFTVGPAVLTGYLLADDLAAEGAGGKTHAAVLASVSCNGGTAAGAAAAGWLVGVESIPFAVIAVAGLALVLVMSGGIRLHYKTER